MRLLYVVPRFPVSTHTFVLWQVSGAVHAGHEVRVLSARRGNPDGYRLAKELGIDQNAITYADCRRSPAWSWSVRRFSRPVRDAARRNRFGRILAERRKTYFCDLLDRAEVWRAELLHCHFLGSAIEVGIPLGSLLGVPVVVSAHSPVADFELEQLRYVQDRADAVIVPSNAERREWIGRTGCERKLVRVWNGAPPVARPIEARTPEVNLRVVSVSRLSPEKRVGDLVSVVALLRGMGYPCLLDIYGEGPLRSDVEALIEEHGLEESVRLRGMASHGEIMASLLGADVFLHAADAETFGVVLIEAMSAGLPVVAARSSGAADIVVDGETGFLVACRDTKALGACVAALARDPALRCRMGQAGRERFEREFSLVAHMRNVEEVWARALSGFKSRR